MPTDMQMPPGMEMPPGMQLPPGMKMPDMGAMANMMQNPQMMNMMQTMMSSMGQNGGDPTSAAESMLKNPDMMSAAMNMMKDPAISGGIFDEMKKTNPNMNMGMMIKVLQVLAWAYQKYLRIKVLLANRFVRLILFGLVIFFISWMIDY
jgi:hypothetical protein